VTVNLTAPAPGGGAAVTLTGSSSAFPTTVVTVSANQTSQTFNNLPTNTVQTATSVTITASYNNSSVVSNSFTVNPASTGSPVALVAHTVSNSFTATNTTTAINTTGATLIVLATNQEFETFGAPTDSAGNTWTLIARQDNSAWYYCLNPTTSANHTFTIGNSLAGIYRSSITVEAFSGSFTGLDTQSSVYTSGSYQPGAITPAHNGELVVSQLQCFVENVGAVAVDSGFTITDYTPINSSPYAFAFAGMAYYVQPTAAAINPTWSGLNNIGYRQMVAQAAFLVSGGSPPSVAVQSVSVSPASVTGGSNVSVTVTLTAAAPSGGALVTLTGSNGAFPTGSLTVPANQTSFTSTTLPTSPVSAATPVTVTASYAGSSATSNSFTVNPPAVQSVSVSPTSVTGGSNVSVTVNLTGPAPSGGAAVTLTGSNGAFPTGSLTVPANQTSFTSTTLPTSPVSAATPVTVTASYAGSSATSNSFTVNPPAVQSVSVSPTSVTGGSNVSVTVNLTGPAPSGGATVTLTGSNGAFPTGSLTVPANQTTFTSSTLPTSPVSSATPVTVTASYAGSSATSNSFTVNPPAVQSVSVSPTSVTGGSNVSVTVNLTGPAPSGGAAVTLTGSNSAFPMASLTVPANQTTFTSSTVPTATVQTATSVFVTASYSGTSANSNSITVNPASSGSPISLLAHTLSTSFSATNTTAAINTTGAKLIVLATNQEFVGFSAPTDSAGNTWTLIARQDNLAWYYCLNPAISTNHTFSVANTYAGIYRTTVAVQAFNGSFTGLDTQANSYVSGSNQAGAITPSHSGELLVSLAECYVESPGTVGVDSGFTLTDYTAINSSPYAFSFSGIAYYVQPTAAAINPTWSGLNSIGYRQFVAVAAFK
jgi:hypothetical protein